MVNVDNALPWIRLIVPTKNEDGSNRFEANPLELADIWSADADGFPVTVAVGWIAFWGLVVVSVNA
jgi:hypothetical protein